MRPTRPALLLLSTCSLLTTCSLLAACGEEPRGGQKGDPGADDAGSDGVTDGGSDGAPDDTGPRPDGDAPWVRDVVETPGPVSFNELHPQPAAGQTEWIELHNPLVIDIDLSGWRLDGAVRYTFPEGTVLGAGGFLVVADDPGALPGRGALGPFDGALSDDGERIELISNGGRRIDSVAYGDDAPWPVGASGTGYTLAKLRAESASDWAEGWTVSAAAGGTPGADNAVDPSAPDRTVALVAMDAVWRFDASGAPPEGWTAPDHDDRAWPSAAAPFIGGRPSETIDATAYVAADNFYAVYVGAADGSDLRLVAADPDGNWASIDGHPFTASPTDHLYLAAWEEPGDEGSPQMLIAQVDLPGAVLGTNAVDFEWVLGLPGATPGGSPPADPPEAAALADEIAEAELDGAWAPPEAEAPGSAEPWGWAVTGILDEAARFVWPDTFDSASITNFDDTYALFRSVRPLVSWVGLSRLDPVPTTTAFRTTFTLDADPADTSLRLSCEIDDGAVIFLNGVEVLRDNMPTGAIGPDTLALRGVNPATALGAPLPAGALLRGENVLAVELHQASADGEDLRFACALQARIAAPAAAPPAVVLHELGPAADASSSGARTWVELRANTATNTEGLRLSTGRGASATLPPVDLAAGALHLVEVDLPLSPGEALFLWSEDAGSEDAGSEGDGSEDGGSEDGDTLLDAVRASSRGRARAEDEAWRSPAAATPGAPNAVELEDAIVINELHYHHAPISAEGAPYAEVEEEWIELSNRGDRPVDLSGWQLVDAVAYRFPEGTELAPGGFLVVARDAAALRLRYPDIDVLGDFDGKLSNGGDQLVLLDAVGNPADIVRYFDGGRWPSAADGGGASLELRDARADNAAPEAWAASRTAEGTGSGWAEYRYRGRADPSAVGPDGLWNELVIGLLDAGEVLIDDLRVVKNPDGAAIDLLPDGGFEDGGVWRLLGNHRGSGRVPDPDDPDNTVLRLVATGPTEHMHNHAEATLSRPIGDGEHEISFRARWVSGANQLHTRLYFNRLARVTRVERPTQAGTPGAPNSVQVDNIGPTFDRLRQAVAVPAPGEPCAISITAQDPDGVRSLTLWAQPDGGAAEPTPMSLSEDGVYSAILDGRPAGSLVQIWVEAEDELGATAMFPAAGPASRALIRWDDGEGSTTGLPTLRLLMTTEDADWLHDPPNLMSNSGLGATVVYGEREVFYDAEVRAKGSQRGRPDWVRLGFGVDFPTDQLFRGRLRSALIDRSEGVYFGQREVLVNLVAARAGLVHAEHNDLVHVVAPRSTQTGPAELQLDRYTQLVLDAQFEDGGDGLLYDYELVYFPYTTVDGSPEGQKLPQPDDVTGAPITDLGDAQEDYRWVFMLQNNEEQDDHGPIIELAQTFALADRRFLASAPSIIDVDQWLRAFALATLAGAVDNYGGDGAWHNARLYLRPEDGRFLYFPHDLDLLGYSTMPVVGNSDLARLIADPANARVYYGHVADLLDRAYSSAYLGRWCAQLGALLPDQNFAGHCAFIDERAAYVRNDAEDALLARFPPVAFAIRSPEDGELGPEDGAVALEGVGWVDVRVIERDGAPVPATWTAETRWAIRLPVTEDDREITLVARDLYGAEVGRDTVRLRAAEDGD